MSGMVTNNSYFKKASIIIIIIIIPILGSFFYRDFYVFKYLIKLAKVYLDPCNIFRCI